MEEQKIPQKGKSVYRMHNINWPYYIVEDRPDIRYLNSHVRSHICSACALSPGIWKDLGIELMGQASLADLDVISVNNHGDLVGRCSSLFSLWLQRQPEANWKQLIDALIKIKLNLLAAELKKSLVLSEQQKSSQQESMEGIYPKGIYTYMTWVSSIHIHCTFICW